MMTKNETRIYNFRAWITPSEPEQIKAYFSNLLEFAGYGVVNFCEHHFIPQGYTSIWLLSESHLAVHTFPEENKTYVELSGCSKEMNDRFTEQFQKDHPQARIENSWV